MHSIEEVLRQAIRTGEVVNIVYNGGSKPGQSRPVIVISVSDEDVVAREPTSRMTKSFKLPKIASASASNGEAAENPSVVPIQVAEAPILSTFTEYERYFDPELRAAGWHVTVSDNYLAVSAYFKSGKPRKTPTVSLQFIDRANEPRLDWETGEFSTETRELTGRERPWRVDSARLSQGKSFGELQRAAELFIHEVRASQSPASAASK